MLNKIFSYNNYNSNYNIKELVFKKLNLKNDYKIETLKDIETLSILFLKNIPYCTFDAGVGKDEYNIDYTVSCIENGGICTQLNIIFGLLLKQIFNFEIYLLKSEENSIHNVIKEFGLHFHNVFIWKDKKLYYHDVGLFKFNVFSPIEINNKQFLNLNNDCVPQPFEHRIVLNPATDYKNENDNSYILQRKVKNELKSIIELKININNLKDNVTFNKIYKVSRYFLKVNSRLILKFTNNGIASLNKYSFILYASIPNSDIIIKVKNNSQFYDIFLEYFNINLINNSYIRNYILICKQ